MKFLRSQLAICSGDQFACNFRATIRRSRTSWASLQVLGRHACPHDRASASAARYKIRPPFLEISRDTVDGGRINLLAIDRRDTPADKPRETSSLSLRVSARGLRRRSGGGMPPCDWKKRYTVCWGLPSVRLISLAVSPAFHRFQSAARSLELKPRFSADMHHPASLPVTWRHGVAMID